MQPCVRTTFKTPTQRSTFCIHSGQQTQQLKTSQWGTGFLNNRSTFLRFFLLKLILPHFSHIFSAMRFPKKNAWHPWAFTAPEKVFFRRSVHELLNEMDGFPRPWVAARFDLPNGVNLRMTNSTWHPWRLTCPQKRDYFNRKYIFQPSFFRGYVSFQVGNPFSWGYKAQPSLSLEAMYPNDVCHIFSEGAVVLGGGCN